MGDSFKSGSGNLSFGDNQEEEASEDSEDTGEEVRDPVSGTTDTEESQERTSDEVDASQPTNGSQEVASTTEEATTTTSTASSSGPRQTDGHRYPYFVRRSNVGDERDNRLEVFARDKVVAQESEFRSRLAAEFETDSVSKTDAREYALLAAFENVEDVAELMREDGYGELD